MNIFFELLQISLSGVFAVLYLLLLRMIFAKFPKRVTYPLWGLAVFYFISPVKPEYKMALIPKVDITEGLGDIHINWNIVFVIYITGVVVLLAVNAVQYIRIFLNLKRNAVRVDKSGKIKVYRCVGGSSAFTFGFFPPKIYIPEGLEEEAEELIILHEKIHIRRGDYWIKLIASILCIINWYNLMAWTAFYFFTRDQEVSCDELVLKKVGNDCRKQYANIIFQAASGFFVSGEKDHALAFGEANIKYRVRRCVKDEKTSKNVMALGVALTIAAFVLGIFVSDRFKIKIGSQRENQYILEEEDEVPEVVWETLMVRTGESYEKRSDGIYLVTERGEDLIAKGHYNEADIFIYADGGVLFAADKGRCIQRYDIYTHKLENVFECEGEKAVNKFTVVRGILKITYNDDTIEKRKITVKEKLAASGKEILENRGEIYNITQWKNDGAYANVDLNSDGYGEEIVLDYSLRDIEDKGMTTYSLLAGKETIAKQINDVANCIYAVSLDGQNITLLVEYMIKNPETGDSLWYTAFYGYKDSLIPLGEIKAEVNRIEVEDGIVNYTESANIIMSEVVRKKCIIDIKGKLQEQKSDYMELPKARYQLKRELTVYDTPAGENTFIIEPQTVDIYKVSYECIWNVNLKDYSGYWVELTCQDQTAGWVFVGAGILPESGINVQDVFAPGVYHHSGSLTY